MIRSKGRKGERGSFLPVGVLQETIEKEPISNFLADINIDPQDTIEDLSTLINLLQNLIPHPENSYPVHSPILVLSRPINPRSRQI
jgi:hypothetical protein